MGFGYRLYPSYNHYEYFASDVAAGHKAPPELKKHKPKAPKVKD
jgi:hypothetical protein